MSKHRGLVNVASPTSLVRPPTGGHSVMSSMDDRRNHRLPTAGGQTEVSDMPEEIRAVIMLALQVADLAAFEVLEGSNPLTEIVLVVLVPEYVEARHKACAFLQAQE